MITYQPELIKKENELYTNEILKEILSSLRNYRTLIQEYNAQKDTDYKISLSEIEVKKATSRLLRPLFVIFNSNRPYQLATTEFAKFVMEESDKEFADSFPAAQLVGMLRYTLNHKDVYSNEYKNQVFNNIQKRIQQLINKSEILDTLELMSVNIQDSLGIYDPLYESELLQEEIKLLNFQIFTRKFKDLTRKQFSRTFHKEGLEPIFQYEDKKDPHLDMLIYNRNKLRIAAGEHISHEEKQKFITGAITMLAYNATSIPHAKRAEEPYDQIDWNVLERILIAIPSTHYSNILAGDLKKFEEDLILLQQAIFKIIQYEKKKFDQDQELPQITAVKLDNFKKALEKPVDKLYLERMIFFIECFHSEISTTEDKYAILRLLTILGECAGNLSEDVIARKPELFANLVMIRNKIEHPRESESSLKWIEEEASAEFYENLRSQLEMLREYIQSIITEKDIVIEPNFSPIKDILSKRLSPSEIKYYESKLPEEDKLDVSEEIGRFKEILEGKLNPNLLGEVLKVFPKECATKKKKVQFREDFIKLITIKGLSQELDKEEITKEEFQDKLEKLQIKSREKQNINNLCADIRGNREEIKNILATLEHNITLKNEAFIRNLYTNTPNNKVDIKDSKTKIRNLINNNTIMSENELIQTLNFLKVSGESRNEFIELNNMLATTSAKHENKESEEILKVIDKRSEKISKHFSKLRDISHGFKKKVAQEREITGTTSVFNINDMLYMQYVYGRICNEAKELSGSIDKYIKKYAKEYQFNKLGTLKDLNIDLKAFQQFRNNIYHMHSLTHTPNSTPYIDSYSTLSVIDHFTLKNDFKGKPLIATNSDIRFSHNKKNIIEKIADLREEIKAIQDRSRASTFVASIFRQRQQQEMHSNYQSIQ